MTTASNLRTIKQLAEDLPAFTEASLRWHVFNRAVNGLSEHGAVVRMGRRVLIDSEAFDRWIESQGGVTA